MGIGWHMSNVTGWIAQDNFMQIPRSGLEVGVIVIIYVMIKNSEVVFTQQYTGRRS